MAPGFNRYTIVLMLLAGGSAVAATGCSNGGGGGGRGSLSTAATTTSSTTPASVTSSTPKGPGPVIAQASFIDKDGSGAPSKGDQIEVIFNKEIKFKTPLPLDASKEFSLGVLGDTLGVGATVASPGSGAKALITLGDRPNLKISGAYITSSVKAGSASGINVSAFASGNIVGVVDNPPIQAGTFVDVAGVGSAAFRDGASMVVARGGHDAVLLDDGRVLIVGGMKDGKKETFVEDAEIFDPATGQFTTVSSISGNTKGRMLGSNASVVVRRIRHTMTKLNDGTVLITGGYGISKKGFFGLFGEKKETIADAHLFDPATNTFSRVGDLKADRHSHTATLMADGRVLIAGGYSDSFWSRNKTEAPFEIYDPKTKTFAEEKTWIIFTKGTVEKRMNHAAVNTDQGVLLAGGEHWEGGYLHFFGKNVLKLNTGSELFQKNAFKKSGNLVQPRRRAAAEVLASKDVILAGGHDDKGLVDGIESYAGGTWTQVAKLATPRANSKVALRNDQLFVIGGFQTGATTGEVKKVEVLDGATKKMVAGYDLKTARNGASVTKLADGRILVAGGFSGGVKSIESLDGQPLASTELFIEP